MPGDNSLEVLACVMCGHREYGGGGREGALPAIAEGRKNRAREGSRWTKRGVTARAAWGSDPFSRTRRSERLEPVTLSPDPVGPRGEA